MHQSSTIALVFLFLLQLFSIVFSSNDKTHPISSNFEYSNCKGLDDGLYNIRLLDNHPLIEMQCSNEYMIIDYSRDSKWSSYFSTWLKYHYAVAASARGDSVNWQEWFLPSLNHKKDWEFILSPTCDVCNEFDEDHQKFGTLTTYYLSALAFGCFAPVRGWPTCDMDFFTYECKLCTLDGSVLLSRDRGTLTQEELGKSDLTGICDFEIRPADQILSTTFPECSDMSPNLYKPSIGMDGAYCVCAKSNNENVKHMIEKQVEIKTEAIETVNANNKVFLHQSDFADGTLRITEPGVYVLLEDIVLDFNPGSKDDPLMHGQAWWPKATQSSIYDGADSARGSYFLGFFAGITVECDNVVLDLSGHTIAMSPGFFYSQAFFSIIELSNQVFLPQQGPGFFGSDPVFANHVIIKNGVLGLSSHHGIHGNYNEYLELRDLSIIDFVTHGIQLNGYKHLWIENVNIGPTSTRAFLNGNYMQMRQILPILHKVAKASASKDIDNKISFANRDESVTMLDIVTNLESMMEKAFRFAVYGNDYSSDADWSTIEEVFINPSGYPYGAVTYGLFLNYPSAGIFGWYVNDKSSYDATVINVNVHGLRHQGEEIVGIAEGGRIVCNAFNGPLSLKSLIGSEIQILFTQALQQFSTANSVEYSGSEGEIGYSTDYADIPDNVRYPTYVGDIVTDVWIAMYYFGHGSFDYWPGIPYYGHSASLIDWAMMDDPLSDIKHTYLKVSSTFSTQCNVDAMFHPPKGLLGIKITGGEDIKLRNIHVYDMFDTSNLGAGSDKCGFKDNYHFSQQSPYQKGYSMNQVHAITIDHSNVDIKSITVQHIYSKTGLVFGLALWAQTKVVISDRMEISNLYAGFELPSGHQLTENSRPNKAPEVCAFRMFDAGSGSVTFADGANVHLIHQYCLSGHLGCANADANTMLGSIVSKHVSCEAFPFAQHSMLHTNILSSQLPSMVVNNMVYVLMMVFVFVLVVVLFICTHKSKVKPQRTDYNLLSGNSNDVRIVHTVDDDYYGTF